MGALVLGSWQHADAAHCPASTGQFAPAIYLDDPVGASYPGGGIEAADFSDSVDYVSAGRDLDRHRD